MNARDSIQSENLNKSTPIKKRVFPSSTLLDQILFLLILSRQAMLFLAKSRT